MNRQKIIAVIAVLLFGAGAGFAQLADGGLGYTGQGGVLMGGIGFANIDGQTFYTINFRPELALGKFGVGLNVDLLFNTDTGEIRASDWNESYDYFRIIRYLRYGHKNDPVYTRVGTLDAATLGHGSIINFYTNEASYDQRKIGLALDIDFGQFGFESVTSNLGRAELIGGRIFYRPFRTVLDVPIIRNFAIASTYARDFNPDDYNATNDGISVYGFDAEVPLIRQKMIYSTLYYDFARIVEYGSGNSFGIMAGIRNTAGLVELHARFERRLLGKEYIPSYFDAFYEIDRYHPVSKDSVFTKKAYLKTITQTTRGWFGELQGGFLNNAVRLIGMYSWLDDEKNSGIMHFAADAPNIPTIAAHATYDKVGIETFEDVLTLDNRSLARAGLGYKIKPYLILYCDYIWTFVYDKTQDRYKPQERVEPRLVFAYNF